MEPLALEKLWKSAAELGLIQDLIGKWAAIWQVLPWYVCREVGWDLIGDGRRFDKFSPWYGGQDFVGDSVLKMPCPTGKSADISEEFAKFWWTCVAAVPAIAWVPRGQEYTW